MEHKIDSTLITRPRRFGKTLNMSMLQCFFEKTEKYRAHLFDNLEISKHKDIIQHQGMYPVISITLKFIEADTRDKTLDDLKDLISGEYANELFSRGINSVIGVGIAFGGKSVLVQSELLSK